MKALAKSAQHVQDVLIQQGYRNQVIELPDSTRSAQEAADTIGCQVSQIAKSIIFRIKEQDAPLLVIASGTNQVNEKGTDRYDWRAGTEHYISGGLRVISV
ncbi:YbaK/EbsC family protein [Paenibacillus sp. 1001270B_150601_E10]|uniref:YbaK/EbsC family protein n=1 Tax=Paenibacillus sp. 1001270B_150601_E10 TaxID=2787079 RepID=UPI00189C5F99|nr:YbaK/EbsC family protein [Paenibacillus sp. 1001270B_150601_E10]